ncbi:MAG: hypothetical protein ACOC3V_04020 [bacterium]
MTKKFWEFIYENNNYEINIDVENIDNELVDKIVDKFSFVYKKRKDRYLRPIEIKGNCDYKDIDLYIKLSNNDVISFQYKDNDDLIVYINDKLIYHLDDIKKNEFIYKVYGLYKNHLEKQRFNINKKSNPFE